jgi:uncharacterized protein YqjF (DUF2071 family)
MKMVWHDLLFAHWPVPSHLLRPHIPESLEIDTHQNQAWLGIVPFHMSGVRARCVPPIPGTSAFPELNVRTYVSPRADPARPGVWFFSLDAASRLAVAAARRFFHLPYFNADLTCDVPDYPGGRIRYRSRRTHKHAPPAELTCRYRPAGPIFRTLPGTLEHFLTARYGLYASKEGLLLRGDIHHDPWPLQPAEADFPVNTMTAQLNLALPDDPPLLHFAKRLDVVAWRPVAVGPPSPAP